MHAVLRTGGHESPRRGLKMRGMIRSLGVVGLALLSVVGLGSGVDRDDVVQLTATALIMGGTGHPLSAPATTPATSSRTWTTRSRCSSTRRRARPHAPAQTRSTGWARATDVYAVTYPAQFFPVFGSQTFDASVEPDVANLNGCVRGTSARTTAERRRPAGSDHAGVPPGPDDFVVFGYSQSAVVASLVEAGPDREPPRAGHRRARSSCSPTRCVPTAVSWREDPRA